MTGEEGNAIDMNETTAPADSASKQNQWLCMLAKEGTLPLNVLRPPLSISRETVAALAGC
jgi:hypothetical protein